MGRLFVIAVLTLIKALLAGYCRAAILKPGRLKDRTSNVLRALSDVEIYVGLGVFTVTEGSGAFV